METLHAAFMIFALACLLAQAAGVAARIQLGWLGLFFWLLSSFIASVYG